MRKTYLALGDSYTIGEQVPLFENFPYQLLQLLRKKYPEEIWLAPEIVAKTGWTTDELEAQIHQTILLNRYDFVTLLIGVNNQYRGRSVDEYRIQFEGLLKKAIVFAGGDVKKVFVLSIPDWGTTPFAADREPEKIAAEIDAYNNACKEITIQHQCHFIDITEDQRKDSGDSSFIASDGLHPSGKEYAKWARMVVNVW